MKNKVMLPNCAITCSDNEEKFSKMIFVVESLDFKFFIKFSYYIKNYTNPVLFSILANVSFDLNLRTMLISSP